MHKDLSGPQDPPDLPDHQHPLLVVVRRAERKQSENENLLLLLLLLLQIKFKLRIKKDPFFCFRKICCQAERQLKMFALQKAFCALVSM